jgi:aminopeptidase N
MKIKLFKSILCSIVVALMATNMVAQPDFYKGVPFSHRDTLLGGQRQERGCFDVMHYDLSVTVTPERKHISGSNKIKYRMLYPSAAIQLDLFGNMHIDSIVQNGKSLNYERDAGAIFITFPKPQTVGTTYEIAVYFEGIPTEAKKAPWDGGFVWQRDPNGKEWIGMACEGVGASLWYPCKDDLSDEPQQGATIHLTVPQGLTAVSNGRMTGEKVLPNAQHRFDWEVKSTINNYNINFTVGDFVHFSDVYISKTDGEKLDLDYWVLRDNLAKAQKHFEQVKPMLEAYEFYFGKYPFWQDGYKLIETPYVGMEHQSGIAYGNKYLPRYLGAVVPAEFDFDFIIIHESGHEYFGNALSCRDHAEMWLHEAFTTYMETLYLERTKDKAAALRYLESQKAFIKNKEPIIGPPGVRYDRWDDSDMYYKGAWFLQTLRNTINDDAKFFAVLRSFYDNHKLKEVGATTYNFRDAVMEGTKLKSSSVEKMTQQYLTYPRIPTLVYSIKRPFFWFGGARVRYTWEANVWDFDMPCKIGNPEAYTTIQPNSRFVREQVLSAKAAKNFKIATEQFYIETREEKKELTVTKLAKPKKVVPAKVKK